MTGEPDSRPGPDPAVPPDSAVAPPSSAAPPDPAAPLPPDPAGPAGPGPAVAAREAAREAARGVDELERYLLRRAERHNAHADALSFTAELPWLTPAQREEVVRLYVRERTVLARHTQRLIEAALEETAARDAAAREALRRRMCVTVSALLGALALALCLLALALIPPR